MNNIVNIDLILLEKSLDNTENIDSPNKPKKKKKSHFSAEKYEDLRKEKVSINQSIIIIENNPLCYFYLNKELLDLLI